MPPGYGGVFNIPAVVLATMCGLSLVRGARESAKANTIMVLIKLGVLALFIVIGFSAFSGANVQPFAPFGTAGIRLAASEGLINAAKEAGAALISLGSARHGPLGRFTPGGIANEMLHASLVPMALAPQGYLPSPGTRLGRVTCAFSGPTQSRIAFEAAAQLSMRHGVPLRRITFVVRVHWMYPSLVGYDAEGIVAEQWRTQAGEPQERALATLPEDVAVKTGVIDERDWDGAVHSLPS